MGQNNLSVTQTYNDIVLPINVKYINSVFFADWGAGIDTTEASWTAEPPICWQYQQYGTNSSKMRLISNHINYPSAYSWRALCW